MAPHAGVLSVVLSCFAPPAFLRRWARAPPLARLLPRVFAQVLSLRAQEGGPATAAGAMVQPWVLQGAQAQGAGPATAAGLVGAGAAAVAMVQPWLLQGAQAAQGAGPATAAGLVGTAAGAAAVAMVQPWLLQEATA